MNRKIKVFSFMSFIFVSLFFINLDGVKAEDDCKCYYQYTYADMNENTTTYVGITFGKNKSDVFLGKKTQNTSAGENTYDITVDRGDPFRVFSDKVVESGCSVDVCNSIDLRFSEAGFLGKSIKIYACDDRCDGTTCNKCTENEKGSISAKNKLEATDAERVPNGTGIGGGVSNPDGSYDHDGDSLVCDDDCITKIQNWAGNGKGILKFNTDEINCTKISQPLKDFLDMFFWIIAIIGVILLIIMTAVEFIKVITLSEEDGLKGAFKHTVIRAICIVILLLLPTLVSFVINVINENADYTVTYTDEEGNEVTKHVKYTIGEDGNPVCSVGE